MAQHRALLDALQPEYGVPPQYIMAFWGVETNYGSFMGDFQVVRSVATLACMTKRRDFFSNETVQSLRILSLNHMTREQMRGSWAGAMGNMQFMPSTFINYGVDRTGDGRIDLWSSLPDVFASSANFLRGIGWKPRSLPPRRLCCRRTSRSTRPTRRSRSRRAWATMGVKRAAARPGRLRRALVDLLPAGFRGPAFILYRTSRR